MGTFDGTELILRRFGDEQSTLLDRFERHSFEVQLNQAILGRSLSEPCVPTTRRIQALPPVLVAPLPLDMEAQVQQGRHRGGSGFKKVIKRLLTPILRRRGGRKEAVVSDPIDPRYWKEFSRSMRV